MGTTQEISISSKFFFLFFTLLLKDLGEYVPFILVFSCFQSFELLNDLFLGQIQFFLGEYEYPVIEGCFMNENMCL